MSSFNDVIEDIERNQIYAIAVTNLPILYEKLKVRINNKYIRPALGFHPELLFEHQKMIPRMWELLNDTRYIGEIGLDFKIGKHYKQLQLQFFEELIQKCNSIGNKILTVHSRSSAEDIVSIIGANFQGKIILHWYSGNKTILSRAINNGYYFSVNYAMVNSISGQQIIESISLDRLLLETDSPFIKFGNESSYSSGLESIVRILSKLKKSDFNTIHTSLWNNFVRLLNSKE
jgi:TatD DNase family protein